MKINSVVGMSKKSIAHNIAFERKLREEEKGDYSQAINQTLDYLGIVNCAMIIHGPSFPHDNEKDINQQIGSPYNSKKFLDFINLHGFNAVQLGPTGKLNRGDTSPYASSVFAKNPLFIDFNLLTTERYGNLLSKTSGAYFEISQSQEKANDDRVDYAQAKKITKTLLDEAYNNFKKKIASGDIVAKKLDADFREFQEKNSSWLDFYAVLDVIATEYGTDSYSCWKTSDAELIQNVKNKNPGALIRYNNIKKANKQEIDRYKFAQFIIDMQSNEDDKKHKNIIYISDLLVGASSFDELIFADAFLEGYKIGAKWGGSFNSPQLWDIPLLNPNKLFNEDGSLGPAGIFLKTKIQKALSNASSIRVDHAMGLVDPFVYKPESVVYNRKLDENGKLVKYPLREKMKAGYLSELDIDKGKNYQKILSKIVLPAMIEMGINPKSAVWEDLGADETGIFNKIFRLQENLPGINVLAWERGENSRKENWAYIGSHDNLPLSIQIKKGYVQNHDAFHPDYLAGYLNPSQKRALEREQFKQNILHSPKALLKAKMADLMRSTQNIQISFMDFFGLREPYNIPGTVGPNNWTLRLKPDYEDEYYKALSNDEYAMNMPEILSIALQAKSDMDVVTRKKTQEQSDREITPLMNKLNHYSEILKEKE